MANKMASSSTSLLIEDQKRLELQLEKNAEGWEKLGQMGRRQLEGTQMTNKMAESATSLEIEKQKRLEAQLKKNAEAWDNLGKMGARQFDGTQMAKQMASAKLSAETLATTYANTAKQGQTWFQRTAQWFAEYRQGTQKVSKDTETMGRSVKNSSDRILQSLRGWMPHMRTAFASIGIYFGVRMIQGIGQTADAYTNLGARLRLVTRNASEFATAQDELYAMSQRNQSGLEETTKLYTRMAVGMRDLGRSQADTLQVVDLVSKSLKISGSSTTEAAAGLMQISQAFQAGIVSGDEYRSMVENMPRLSKAIADGLGITLGQLRKLSESQKLTAEVAIDAILRQSAKLNAEASKIPLTIGRAYTELSNAMLKYVGDADQANGASKLFAQGLELLARNIDTVMKVLLLPVTVADGWIKLIALIKQAKAETLNWAIEVENSIRKFMGMKPIEIKIELDRKWKDQVDELYNVTPAITQKEAKQRRQDEWETWTSTQESQMGLTKALDKYTQEQKRYIEYGLKMAEKYKVDAAFVLAIMDRETHFRDLTSPVGARGPMQMMPGTAKRFGVDNNDYQQNIEGGVRYLKLLLGMFKNDMKLAAAAYNAGEHRIIQYGNKVPPFKETRKYVGDLPDPVNPSVPENYRKWSAILDQAQGDMQKYEDRIKDVQEANNELYQDEIDHIKRVQEIYDIRTKRLMESHTTRMDQLEAERKAAEEQSKSDIANASVNGVEAVAEATRKASEQQEEFLKRKNDLLVKGLDLERTAAKERVIDIGVQIQRAQATGQRPDVIKELRLEQKKWLSELSGIEERKKQLQIKTIEDVADVRRQYDSQARQEGKAQAEAEVQRQQEIAKVREEEIALFQQSMALQIDQAKAAADSRKADIDGRIEQAKAQAATNEAERQAAMEGKEGLEAIGMARQNLNAKLAETLNLITLERDANLEKLRIDGEILASQRALLETYKAIAEQQGDRGKVLDYERQLQDVYTEQTKNIRARLKAETDAVAASAKAQVDNQKQGRTLDGQEVKESQLRMNAFWDQYMSRLRDYASLWQEITGQTENGWSRMSVAAGEYMKQANQIGDYWQSDAGKNWGNLAPMMESVQQAQAALAGMAKSLVALRSNYAEGSQSYKDMTSAAERLMEVQRLLAVVEGVIGVLHQLKSGDPYTAPARAAMAGAIVAAQLASIGMSSAAVPGFSASQAQKAAQAGGSTSAGGGVFGDTSAKSDSINKSLEIVAQSTTANLGYSAGMLRALTDIKFALMGTTNAVIRNVGPQSGLNLKAPSNDMVRAMFDPIGMSFNIGAKVFGDPVSKLMAKLSQFLLNTTKKITDWGLAATQQTLGSIMRGGFQGQGFTDVTTTTKVLGITVQKSTKRYFAELNGAVNSEFTRAIVGVANTVAEAGKAFGLGAKDFEDRLKNFVVSFGSISTKGLKGEELQEAISQMFSAMSDDMARAFMPGLDAFMQAGEGYLQTLVRVADGINVATGMLAQAGIDAINYQAIILKQGDVASEIVRQSIVAFEGVGSAIGAYVDQAVGSAEELMSVYRDLLIVSDIAKVVGFDMNALTQALIVTSGGVAQFLSNLQTYQTEIAGGSEYARQIITLRREFAKLGESLPANNREFVKLVNGIDTSTEAGQKLYAQVIALADGFAKAQAEAKKLDELRAKYRMTDPLQGYRDQLAQIDEDFKAINEGVIARMKGGPQYLKRTNKIDVLKDRIDDRELDRDLIQADIDELEAKGKLTAAEKQRLATLRQQRKELDTEIKAAYKQIAAIEELIKKNPNTENILKEKAALIEEQGNAILKTIADIWDQMTANINAAKETLIAIQNDIYELTFTAGSPDIKLGMATAKAETARQVYFDYDGTDIVKLREFADEYHKAIMDEYNAKMDMIMAPKIALEKERDLAQKAHDEKIAALEKELGATKELADAVKSIQEYVKGLRLSSNSTLSPKKLLDEARRQYTETLVKAQGGDVEAMRQITGASDAYLDAARRYFGSGGKYGQIFDGVVAAMDQLGGTPTGDADSIQARIDALNKDHEVYLKSIEQKIAALKIEDKIKELQLATAAKLQALADNLGPRIQAAADKAKEDMQTLIDEVIAQKVLNADQLQALRDIAKGIGIEGYQGATPSDPAIPKPTDDWVQDIFKKWNEGQTGYKPPPSAFGMSSTMSVSSLQSASPMPTYINDQESQGKPITMEVMPRYINDMAKVWTLQDKQNQAAQSKDHDETIAALHELRTELRALVTTQSGANPQLIERLENIERRLAYMERDAKLKPA